MAHKNHKTLRTPNAGNTTINNHTNLVKDLRKYYGNNGYEITNNHESSKTILISSLEETNKIGQVHIMPRTDNVAIDSSLAGRFVNAFNQSISSGWIKNHLQEMVNHYRTFGDYTEDDIMKRLYIGIIDRTSCDMNDITRVTIKNNKMTIEDAKQIKKPAISFCLVCLDCGGAYHTTDFTM